jgi:iron complex transport system substrate-binding protein
MIAFFPIRPQGFFLPHRFLLCCAALLLAATPAFSAVSIVDDSGASVTLAGPARRIIPLYAGLGETLAAMGLADRIIARTASDDTLPAALPAVGTHMRPNQELIVGLSPDLVLQFEGREEAGLAAESLIRLGIPVARFRISSFAELFSCVEKLGVLTGEAQKAKNLRADMQRRLEVVKEKAKRFPVRPKIFFEVRYPNLLGAGAGSMVNDIILAAGGENILARHSERMVRLSEEALALGDPDLYLVQRGAMNKDPVPLDRRSHFRGLAAVRRGFVREVPESLYSRTGPQSVAAVEDLAAYIHLWLRCTLPSPYPARGSKIPPKDEVECPHPGYDKPERTPE